jgi:hypothetical protein
MTFKIRDGRPGGHRLHTGRNSERQRVFGSPPVKLEKSAKAKHERSIVTVKGAERLFETLSNDLAALQRDVAKVQRGLDKP